jgi:surface antigen
LLIAALTAPTLAGCGGFGFGDNAAPVASAAPAASAPPAAVSSLPPPSAPAPATPVPSPIPTGAALGGVLGGLVGVSLTDADRQVAWQAQIAALDSGKPRSWRGAHGVFGSVEPGAETGAGCRAYSQTIYVAGRPNRGQGVACKQPDGGWKMTS